MNSWETNWFFLFLARERQQRFLRDAETDHALHNARGRREPRVRSPGLRAWIARTFNPAVLEPDPAPGNRRS